MSDHKVFDKMAAGYDERFTFSLTGSLQREKVRRLLKSKIRPGMKVLEINCGTGEDAFYLSGLGCSVTAADGSRKMIDLCTTKAGKRNSSSGIKFTRLDFSELRDLQEDGAYDLIYSNFSGLNCIGPEEIGRLSGMFSSLLKKDGSMIIVVFGTRCAWERTYMLFKGRFREIKRRKRNTPVKFNFDGNEQMIWYYSPARFRQIFAEHFSVQLIKPVGLFIPPTYMEKFFSGKKSWLKILAMGEKWFGNISLLSDYGDHYLAEFRKI
jgi:ubiquinone/menaquinone biosynthesis C-methylase UbiE